MDVIYDEHKFTEMLLHMADRLRDDRAGGATKLNKVLYFSDFAHVRRHGQPISAAEYFKLENGPAPRRLKPVRSQLIASAQAALINEDFVGYEVHRLVPMRAADLSLFDPAEIETMDRVVDDLAPLTGRQVSELSHEEPGWRFTELGSTIGYHWARVAKEQVATPAAYRLALAAAQHHGIPIDA